MWQFMEPRGSWSLRTQGLSTLKQDTGGGEDAESEYDTYNRAPPLGGELSEAGQGISIPA